MSGCLAGNRYVAPDAGVPYAPGGQSLNPVCGWPQAGDSVHDSAGRGAGYAGGGAGVRGSESPVSALSLSLCVFRIPGSPIPVR